MFALAVLAVHGYASYIVKDCGKLEKCAGTCPSLTCSDSCATIMQVEPTIDTSLLTADGLTDGGTYTPGANISLSVGGSGQCIIREYGM